MTLNRNDCPNPACARQKPRDKAFCLPCWRRIPHAVQDQVYASYRSTRSGAAPDPFAHIDFLDALGVRLAAGVGDWPEAPTHVRAQREAEEALIAERPREFAGHLARARAEERREHRHQPPSAPPGEPIR